MPLQDLLIINPKESTCQVALIGIVPLMVCVPFPAPAAPEDEGCDPAAPAFRRECRIPAGEGAAQAAPVVREVLRALGAARVHHLPKVHQDDRGSRIFRAQNPAHHRHHHPQRWVWLVPVLFLPALPWSFPAAKFSQGQGQGVPKMGPKQRQGVPKKLFCPKVPKTRPRGAQNVPKTTSRGAQNVVVPKYVPKCPK